MFRQRQDQDKACCPFNKSHIFDREKFIFHINRCKDREKVKHLFATCRFNGLHFVPKQEIEQHQNTCPDRTEMKRMVDEMKQSYLRSRALDPSRSRSRSRSRDRKKE